MAGPAVVLIPGLLCDDALWSAQIEALARFSQIIKADVTQEATIAGMAAAVLEQSPPSFSLIGFSLGGQVALEITRTAIERVQRLALLSTTHGGLLPATATAMRASAASIEKEGLRHYLEQAYPLYFPPSRLEDAGLKSAFIDMGLRVGKEAGLRQMQALLGILHPFTHLGDIRCATLILGGAEDHRATPEVHRELQQEIPGSELVLVKGAAHFTPMEQPQAVNNALQRWLTA